MSDLNELGRFKATVEKLADILIKYIRYATEHRNYNKIPVVILEPVLKSVLSSYEPRQMLESFVRHSYPYWNQIQESQTDFARNHMAELFPLIPDQYIPALLDLWDSYLDEDQKKVLMIYLQTFVKISIQFIHYQRQPALSSGKIVYLREYMNEIWVRERACQSKCAGCSNCGKKLKIQILAAISAWSIQIPPPSIMV